MAEIDKINYDDLFEGDPFEQARQSLLRLIAETDNLIKKNKEASKALLVRVESQAKSNSEEVKAIQDTLRQLQQLAIQQKNLNNIQKKAKNELNNLDKKKKELSFEEIVALEKQKIERAELVKKAKEQAKEELGISKNAEKTASAYARLDEQLKILRKQYKDIAAEAAELELSGDNPERLADLKRQLEQLQPEVTRLDELLKQIDANVGQFQRQVGSYKVAIVEAFNETKGKINENVKVLLGADERIASVVEATQGLGEAFKKAGEGIESGTGKLKVFISFLKNLTKAGVLGLVLVALSSLQAVAQSTGGVFNDLKDNAAGAGDAFTTFFGNILQGEFRKAFSSATTQAFELGKEISRLKREFERLSVAINNSLGNLQSTLETYNKIKEDTFRSDQERFKAATDAFDEENKIIELRIAGLERQLQIAQKTLELEKTRLKTNKEGLAQAALIEDFVKGRKAILDYFDEFKKLPDGIQNALLEIDSVTGNIQVELDNHLRARLEQQKFFIDRAFKDLNFNASKQLAILKSNIDVQFNALDESISFDDARKSLNNFIQQLRNGFVQNVAPILKQFGVDSEILNQIISENIRTAEEVRQILSQRGLGEEVQNEIIDKWEDINGEIDKYRSAIIELNKQEQEARKEGLLRQRTAKQVLQTTQLEFDVEQERIKIQKEGLPAILRAEKLQEELVKERIKQIKENLQEQLKNERLTNEQRVALELEAQNEINQILTEAELERQRLEQERLHRIKQLNNEIIQIEQERNLKRLEEEVERNRSFILLNLSKIKKSILEISDIRVEQLIKERDELLLQAQSFEEQQKIYEKFNKKLIDISEETRKRLKQVNKDALNEVIDFAQQVISGAQQEISKNFQNTINEIDKSISSLQSAAERERELAEQGLASNLDDVERRAAELEFKRRQVAKREQAAQFALAFANSLASYAKEDPRTAVQKAFKDIILAKILASAIAGAFAEGVEGFQGKGTETSDSNLVLISKGESVITAKATKKYAGLPTAMNEGKVEQWFNERRSEVNIRVDELGNLINQKVSETGARIVRSINKRVRL